MGAADQPSSRDYVSPESVPGAIIADKYRVDGVIGRGGVGVVVAATHLDIAQRVAIKMIRDDVPLQHELLDRFQREARAAAMIRSEHVTRVLDVGRLPNGRPYIVMEFLDGEDLERVISRGAMPCKNAVDLALQTCEALAAAHRSGIIHRDLKPANLFLTRRVDGAPLVKVLDFGISKIQPLTTVRVGRGVETTSIMGSPGYMAPEQMKSTRDVDARADIWSVGAVLYELVVGRPAFDGSSMIEILNAIATCKPIPPSARVPGVPPALDRVIARCLTASPDGRFATVAALAVALQPFASPGGAGVADRVIQISREPPPVLEDPPFLNLRPEADPSTVTVMASRRRPSRVPLVAAAALGPLLVGLAALSYYAIRSQPRRPVDAAIAAPPPLAAVPSLAFEVDPPASAAIASAASSSTAAEAIPASTSPRAPTSPPSSRVPARKPARTAPSAQADQGSDFGDRK